ncbi:MAG: divergent PAP2 family protein [Clostridia bacterium]
MDISLVLSNPVLNACFLSWIFAQGIKSLINILKHKSFDKKKLTSAGGMPSSHSAVVCALLFSSLYDYGFHSFQFAFSAVLSLIVMYDATGVRWAASLHARAINNLVIYLNDGEEHKTIDIGSIIPKLDESLGHRVIEVICGAGLGIAIATVTRLITNGGVLF